MMKLATSSYDCQNCCISRKRRFECSTKYLVCLTLLQLSPFIVEYGCMASPNDSKIRSKNRVPSRKLAATIRCLENSNDVGCETFHCLSSLRPCELDGLENLCKRLSETAGGFNRQGKLFIKRSLRCLTEDIKVNFKTRGKKCSELEDFILRVGRNCINNTAVCKIARSNVDSFKKLLSPNAILSKEVWLELLQAILSCGADVNSLYRDVVTSTLGESIISSLKYLQTGASFSLTDVLVALA